MFTLLIFFSWHLFLFRSVKCTSICSIGNLNPSIGSFDAATNVTVLVYLSKASSSILPILTFFYDSVYINATRSIQYPDYSYYVMMMNPRSPGIVLLQSHICSGAIPFQYYNLMAFNFSLNVPSVIDSCGGNSICLNLNVNCFLQEKTFAKIRFFSAEKFVEYSLTMSDAGVYSNNYTNAISVYSLCAVTDYDVNIFKSSGRIMVSFSLDSQYFRNATVIDSIYTFPKTGLYLFQKTITAGNMIGRATISGFIELYAICI